jgi:hypothetical protein
MTDRFQHPSHLAVASFAYRDCQHAVACATPLVEQ